MKKKVGGYLLALTLFVQCFCAGWVGNIDVKAATTSMFDADTIYYITDTTEEKSISLIWNGGHGASMEIGVEQGLYDYYSGWKFIYDSNRDAYKIVLASAESTLLGVRIDTCTSYVSVVTYSTSPTSSSYNASNKYWIIKKSTNGSYKIFSYLYDDMVLAVSGKKLVLGEKGTSLANKWRISARKLCWMNAGVINDDAAITDRGFLGSIDSWKEMNYISCTTDDSLIPLDTINYEDAFALIGDKNVEVVFVDTHCDSSVQQFKFGTKEGHGSTHPFAIVTSTSSTTNCIKTWVSENAWKHIRLIVWAACGTGQDSEEYPSIAKISNTYFGARCSIGFEGILKKGSINDYEIYGVDVENWQIYFSNICQNGYNITAACAGAEMLVQTQLSFTTKRDCSLNPVIFGDGNQILAF